MRTELVVCQDVTQILMEVKREITSAEGCSHVFTKRMALRFSCTASYIGPAGCMQTLKCVELVSAGLATIRRVYLVMLAKRLEKLTKHKSSHNEFLH